MDDAASARPTQELDDDPESGHALTEKILAEQDGDEEQRRLFCCLKRVEEKWVPGESLKASLSESQCAKEMFGRIFLTQKTGRTKELIVFVDLRFALVTISNPVRLLSSWESLDVRRWTLGLDKRTKEGLPSKSERPFDVYLRTLKSNAQ